MEQCRTELQRVSGGRIPNAVSSTASLSARDVLGREYHDLGLSSWVSWCLHEFRRSSHCPDTARCLRKLVWLSSNMTSNHDADYNPVSLRSLFSLSLCGIRKRSKGAVSRGSTYATPSRRSSLAVLRTASALHMQNLRPGESSTLLLGL